MKSYKFKVSRRNRDKLVERIESACAREKLPPIIAISESLDEVVLHFYEKLKPNQKSKLEKVMREFR